jgi:hydroxymethylpyrimidine/phosphomethylpyrimidine kinase
MDSGGRIVTCLSIAGSDSGGGAGIQADLKAFARCGVHGMTAITALTAQSTVGVEMVAPVEPEMIVAQVRAVAEDIGVDGVKVGMLGDEPTIGAVVEALDLIEGRPVVVDPVMVPSSGAVLLDPGAKVALIDRVLPRATVATPNLAEARELAGIGDQASPEALARAIRPLGPAAVIVTGGHWEEGADLLFDGSRAVRIEGPRYPEGASHGSGCTHSSTLAACLARGLDLESAARRARQIAAEAVRDGLRELGRGPGPVDALGLVGGRAGGEALP